jgi:hypothetical protein
VRRGLAAGRAMLMVLEPVLLLRSLRVSHSKGTRRLYLNCWKRLSRLQCIDPWGIPWTSILWFVLRSLKTLRVWVPPSSPRVVILSFLLVWVVGILLSIQLCSWVGVSRWMLKSKLSRSNLLS